MVKFAELILFLKHPEAVNHYITDDVDYLAESGQLQQIETLRL